MPEIVAYPLYHSSRRAKSAPMPFFWQAGGCVSPAQVQQFDWLANVLLPMPLSLQLEDTPVQLVCESIRGEFLTLTANPRIAWQVATAERLKHLIEMPMDWDERGAEPVTVDVVTAAIDILNRWMQPTTAIPALIPSSTGSLQLEWHERGLDLEIEVEANGKAHVGFEDADEEWDRGLGESDRILRKAFERLSS